MLFSSAFYSVRHFYCLKEVLISETTVEMEPFGAHTRNVSSTLFPSTSHSFLTPPRRSVSSPFHSPAGSAALSEQQTKRSSRDDSLLANSLQSAMFVADQAKESSLSGFLYSQGFLKGVCSDVTIRAFGKKYALHKLILLRSPFFCQLFSGPWRDSGYEDIDLSFKDDQNMTVEAFELAIARLYGHTDSYAEAKHAMSLLAVSSFLDMQDLVESSVNLVIHSVTPQNLPDILHFALNNDYGGASRRLITSCKNILYCDGWEMGVRAWNRIPTTIAAEIVCGNPFYVPTEWDRCMFTIGLINWHIKHHTEYNPTDSASEHDEGVDESEEIGERVTDDEADIEQEDNEMYSLEPLRRAMDSGIHYVHFTAEQMLQIDAVRDLLGSRVVSERTLQEALWTTMSLRLRIVSSPLTNETLGFVKRGPLPQPDKDGKRAAYVIPMSDETTVGVGSSIISSGAVTSRTLSVSSDEEDDDEEELSYTNFPPYRFSLEFKDVAKLKEDKRVYSSTIWYAGSYWNVYIQKVKQRKSVVQMGVYLHRAKSSGAQDSETRPPANANFDVTGTARPFGEWYVDNDLTRRTSEVLTHLQTEHINANTSPLGNTFGTASSHLTGPKSPEYLDMRPKIATYFEIFTQSRKGKHALTCFSSSPDMFSFSQSWVCLV